MTTSRCAALMMSGFYLRPTHVDYVDERIRIALDDWGSGEVPFTGDFLRAVLSNDLTEACGRADDYNLLTLPAIVAYVYNNLPADCHGSRERYEAWASKHRE